MPRPKKPPSRLTGKALLHRVDMLLGRKETVTGTVWSTLPESQDPEAVGQKPAAPWTLYFDDWLAEAGPTLHRVRHHPVVTFEQWLAANGIARSQVVTDDEEADAIAGQVFAKVNRTMREASLLRALVEKLEHTKNLRDAWLAETSTREEQVPLDMSREADRAFARTAYKRMLRRAIAEGHTVAPELRAWAEAQDGSRVRAGPRRLQELR